MHKSMNEQLCNNMVKFKIYGSFCLYPGNNHSGARSTVKIFWLSDMYEKCEVKTSTSVANSTPTWKLKVINFVTLQRSWTEPKGFEIPWNIIKKMEYNQKLFPKVKMKTLTVTTKVFTGFPQRFKNKIP